MGETLVFKKYANRRLYDTENSRYVTLEEVTQLIRQGREIQVLEAKTDEDVTAFILTQIVLEEARTRNLMLPVPVLHMIIRYGHTVLGEFFDQYLQPILQTYMDHKNAFDRHFHQWIGLGTGFTEMAQRTFSDLGPFSSFFNMPGKQGKAEKDKE